MSAESGIFDQEIKKSFQKFLPLISRIQACKDILNGVYYPDMEATVSEVLENVLSLLSLEGSFEVEEKEEGVFVSIETADAGRLIGHQGETLAALQLIVNLIVSKQMEGAKRVIIDVSNWRKGKEEELAEKAKRWAEEVKESGQPKELEPMPSWQRRVVHMVIQETEGVSSESVGEGLERHLVITPEKQT